MSRQKDPAQNPCSRACPKRTQTCHGDGSCPDYLAFFDYSRKQDKKRRMDAKADELLIHGVNRSIAIRRMMKGKQH